MQKRRSMDSMEAMHDAKEKEHGYYGGNIWWKKECTNKATIKQKRRSTAFKGSLHNNKNALLLRTVYNITKKIMTMAIKELTLCKKKYEGTWLTWRLQNAKWRSIASTCMELSWCKKGKIMATWELTWCK